MLQKTPPKKTPQSISMPKATSLLRTPCFALGGAASPQHQPLRLVVPGAALSAAGSLRHGTAASSQREEEENTG